MNSDARKLHAEAAAARESHKFLESLGLNDQALLAYDLENDSLGFSEGIGCRAITLRILAGEHEDSWRILTIIKHEIMASVEIAQKSGIVEALAIPYFELGKVQEALGDITEAVKSYRNAVDYMRTNPPASNDTPGALANMELHLATARYATGEKDTLSGAEFTLSGLSASSEIDPYVKAVWLSGGHMRLAEATAIDNKDTSREHLQKAKTIIDANPRLEIKKGQWEKLSKKLQEK